MRQKPIRTEEYPSYRLALSRAVSVHEALGGVIAEVRIDGPQRQLIQVVDHYWRHFYYTNRSQEVNPLIDYHPAFVFAVNRLVELCDIAGFRDWCRENDELVRRALAGLVAGGRKFHESLLPLLPETRVSSR